jgi:hypothetical protein
VNHSRLLLDLIATAHGPDAARRFALWEPSDAAFDALTRISSDILERCKPVPGACTVMSTLLAERLSGALGFVVPVVAGALKVKGTYIFGGNAGFDGEAVFSRSARDWDGHVWIAFGTHVADISLGRTARSGRSHRLLADLVHREFAKAGLIALTAKGVRDAGLVYLPRYALHERQVAALAAGARALFGLDR